MQQLERASLRTYTPCTTTSAEEQAAALAIVHAEFILIRPFREGNGRCRRLLTADGIAGRFASRSISAESEVPRNTNISPLRIRRSTAPTSL